MKRAVHRLSHLPDDVWQTMACLLDGRDRANLALCEQKFRHAMDYGKLVFSASNNKRIETIQSFVRFATSFLTVCCGPQTFSIHMNALSQHSSRATTTFFSTVREFE